MYLPQGLDAVERERHDSEPPAHILATSCGGAVAAATAPRDTTRPATRACNPQKCIWCGSIDKCHNPQASNQIRPDTRYQVFGYALGESVSSTEVTNLICASSIGRTRRRKFLSKPRLRRFHHPRADLHRRFDPEAGKRLGLSNRRWPEPRWYFRTRRSWRIDPRYAPHHVTLAHLVPHRSRSRRAFRSCHEKTPSEEVAPTLAVLSS